MNKSRLIIAIAVLLGVAAAVVVTTRRRAAETTLEKPSATLPTVKKDDITSFEIQKPGQPAIVLQKQSDKWRITQPIEAEAAQPSVDSVLEKLSDLKVTGIAASRKENHARLEVDKEHGIHVVAKGGDKPLLDLYVGQSKSGGTMMRAEGQDPVLAVRGSIRYAFDKEVKDFRNREITDLDAAELSALSISSAKGNFKFERQGEAWTQAQGEKPIAKFDGQRVQTLAGALANLRASDFAAPGESDEATGLATPTAKVELTKKDGSTVSVLLGKEHASGSDNYLRTSQSDVVYRVAKFTADQLTPDAKSFEKVEPQPAAEAPPGMPGMGGAGGPGGGLPPEVMQQLQRQMAAQGGSPHGAH
jgi:hypothetical protein